MRSDRSTTLHSFVRGGRRLILCALVLGFIAFVPLVPYSPHCGWFESTGPVLAEPYRSELSDGLDIHAVPHLQAGPFVLLRLWDWLDDPDDWVLNASNKSIYALLEGTSVHSTGVVPADVQSMTERPREPGQVFPELTCDLVRAVANEGW